MKRIILLLSLICLFSCDKQERCAICTTTMYINGSTEGVVVKKIMVCDKDLEALNGRVDRLIEEDCAEITMISITRCE